MEGKLREPQDESEAAPRGLAGFLPQSEDGGQGLGKIAKSLGGHPIPLPRMDKFLDSRWSPEIVGKLQGVEDGVRQAPLCGLMNRWMAQAGRSEPVGPTGGAEESRPFLDRDRFDPRQVSKC